MIRHDAPHLLLRLWIIRRRKSHIRIFHKRTCLSGFEIDIDPLLANIYLDPLDIPTGTDATSREERGQEQRDATRGYRTCVR